MAEGIVNILISMIFRKVCGMKKLFFIVSTISITLFMILAVIFDYCSVMLCGTNYITQSSLSEQFICGVELFIPIVILVSFSTFLCDWCKKHITPFGKKELVLSVMANVFGIALGIGTFGVCLLILC